MNKRLLLFPVVIGVAIAAGILFLRGPGTNKIWHAKSTDNEHPNVGADKTEAESVESPPGSTGGQAAQLLGKLSSAVDHFRNLPFKPEYGNETFDNTKPLSETQAAKWKRHCRLRDGYTSERIREPAFLEIYELVHQFNLDDDMDKLCYLNDIAHGLSEALLYATDYSPELVSDTRKKELEEFLKERILWYRDILTTIFEEEVEHEFIEALMEIHPSGGIGDPSTHIEPGERLLIN